MSNSHSQFIDTIQNIVCQVLHNEGLLKDEWHLGVVTQVNSAYSLSVKVNGSSNEQTIPCNPNVSFSVGDNVFVHFVNGHSANKYVPYKRATGTETTINYMVFKGTVNTYASIATTFPSPQEGWMVVVVTDETKSNARTTYVYSGGQWVYL